MKYKLFAAALTLLTVFFGMAVAADVYDSDGAEYVYEISGGEVTITGCTVKERGIKIPDTIGGRPVTAIADNAFMNETYLYSVNIPKSVEKIGAEAFSGCRTLSYINIPDGVKAVEPRTFYGCESLTSVEIPNSVTKIGDAAFWCCRSIKNVKMSENVTGIGECAFLNCKKMTSVNLPDNISYLGRQAFDGCESLETITIPSKLTKIEMSLFDGCKSLSAIEIPSGIAVIDTAAFSGCTGLVSVTVPSCVSYIGELAFADCISLEKVYYDGLAALWDNIIVKKEGNEYLLNAEKLYAHTVQFAGDYFGIQEVGYGKNAVLPKMNGGYKYEFTADGKAWDGKNITRDAFVTVAAVPVKYRINKTSSRYDNGMLHYEFEAEAENPVNAVLIFALYGDDGLESLYVKTLDETEKCSVHFDVNSKGKETYYKAYVFENLTYLTPLSNIITENL